MRKVVLVGCGSAIGALLRYVIRDVSVIGTVWNIPADTMLINVIGAFLIAFVTVLSAEVWPFDQDIRVGITTGLLGGFTTFSLICRECTEMIQNGMLLTAEVYMFMSVAFGLIGIMLGKASAEKLGDVVEVDEEERMFEESDVI